MEVTANQNNCQEKTARVQSRIDIFFKNFCIGTLLNRSNISKVRGTSPLAILLTIFSLPFSGKNVFRGIVQNHELNFSKDAAYDLLNGNTCNWRNLLFKLSVKVVCKINGLTSESREKVIIIDDSTYDKSRSKLVELLSKVYDHTTRRYLKGFRLLTVAWSDGASLLPLDFALLSSTKKKNRYQEITKEIDKRSCGYLRRKEALTKSTDLLEPMIQRVLGFGIRVNYILMDSWFALPNTIQTLSAHVPVICMLKRMCRVFYTYNGKKLNLEMLYRNVKKRSGKAKIKASIIVTMNDKLKVKIVFFRDRSTKNWLALLSTDTALENEEIVRIYGKRWDIEVFFKMEKHYLDLVKGVQVRDYDGLIAHTTIALLRYIFLSYEQRLNNDPRSFGELFYAYCDEIKDLTLFEALQRIITLAISKIRNYNDIAEQFVQNTISVPMDISLELLDIKLPFRKLTTCS